MASNRGGYNERSGNDRVRSTSTARVDKDRYHYPFGKKTKLRDYDKIIPWTVALNKINFASSRFRSTNFKYFALKNPPDESSAKMGEYFQGDGHNYATVQQTLQEAGATLKADLTNNIIDGDKIIKYAWIQSYDDLKKITREVLMQERQRAFETEKQLFDSVMRGTINKIDYETLINNTSLGKPAIVNDSNLASMDTVNFWTRMGLGMIKNGETQQLQLTDELIFSLIVGSQEFYSKLKSDGPSSIFSRHAARKWYNKKYNQNLDLSEDLKDKIDEQSLLILQQGLDDFIQNQDIGISTKNALTEIVTNALSTYLSFNKRTKKYSLKKGKDSTSARQASSLIRQKIREGIEKAKKDYPDIPTSIQLGDESDNTVFFIVYTDGINYNALYKQTLEVQSTYLAHLAEDGDQISFRNFLQNSKEYQKQLIDSTMDLFSMTMKEMSTQSNCRKLSLQGLGIFNIWNYNISLSDFYSRGAQFCQKFKDNRSLLVYGSFSDSLWKSFQAANNNAYLSGLFGEISALSRINTILGKQGIMTGSVFSTGANYGESVNDLTYLKTAAGKIGVNVKHYITSTGNELTLYHSDTGISIYNDTIKKYLTWQETEILRFIAVNSGLFDRSFMINAARTFAYNHIAEFYRFQDRSKGSATNVLFQLNNVIYPLTYIYDNAIHQLDEINKKDTFFDIDVRFYKSLFMYKDINEAREKWTDADFRISQRKTPTGETTVRIKTKGLKINLMNLSLFV